jgi:hypothetical protein
MSCLPSCAPLLLVATAAFVSVLFFSTHHNHLILPPSPASSCYAPNDTFLALARRFNTDKVSTHRYDQHTSLDTLIHHALVPGGIYVIEDLLTSGDGDMRQYHNHPINVAERIADLQQQMMLESYHTSPALNFTTEDLALLRVVKWISCGTGVCALKTYDERDIQLSRRWPRE